MHKSISEELCTARMMVVLRHYCPCREEVVEPGIKQKPGLARVTYPLRFGKQTEKEEDWRQRALQLAFFLRRALLIFESVEGSQARGDSV